jgi:hypothetical protein
MDADAAILAGRSIRAVLRGPRFIDREYDGSEWERRYYTAVYVLYERDQQAWRKYQYGLIESFGQNPESRRPAGDGYVRAERLFREILREFGICLAEI